MSDVERRSPPPGARIVECLLKLHAERPNSTLTDDELPDGLCYTPDACFQKAVDRLTVGKFAHSDLTFYLDCGAGG